MRYDHDCSISDDTICHDLVSPSDTIQIRLDRIVPIGSTMVFRPATVITMEVPDLGRCGTRVYVLMRSSQTDTPCCDRMRLWSCCLSQSPSRIPPISATIGQEGNIYSQTDYRLHCVCQDLLRLTLDGWLRMGLLPPPPQGNFADISYLVEN